ncbi:MAG: Trm112 family protein [Promethearchaeota archaeon]
MKPWLFDILACPIDKYYPLKLYIFTYETNPNEFQEIIDIYKKRDIKAIKKENIIELFHKEGGNIIIKDNIVFQKTPIENYLKQIVSSIEEMNNIIDKTSHKLSKICLEIIITKILTKIKEFLNLKDYTQIENLLPELYFVNKIKSETEIESGLLFCEKCLRWFPIVETIPQMLPDEYRDEQKDVQFLENNKNLLDDEFFNQNIKPFNI